MLLQFVVSLTTTITAWHCIFIRSCSTVCLEMLQALHALIKSFAGQGTLLKHRLLTPFGVCKFSQPTVRLVIFDFSVRFLTGILQTNHAFCTSVIQGPPRHYRPSQGCRKLCTFKITSSPNLWFGKYAERSLGAISEALENFKLYF